MVVNDHIFFRIFRISRKNKIFIYINSRSSPCPKNVYHFLTGNSSNEPSMFKTSAIAVLLSTRIHGRIPTEPRVNINRKNTTAGGGK